MHFFYYVHAHSYKKKNLKYKQVFKNVKLSQLNNDYKSTPNTITAKLSTNYLTEMRIGTKFPSMYKRHLSFRYTFIIVQEIVKMVEQCSCAYNYNSTNSCAVVLTGKKTQNAPQGKADAEPRKIK